MLSHLRARNGGVGVSDAGEKHTQVIVDFGRGADGGTRVAGVYLLFDGYGRRQTLDVVAFRLRHAA